MLDKIQVLADGVDHSEGVAWGNDGFLYSGGEEGQIYRISLDGSFEEIARGKGEILGVAVSGSGNVYAKRALPDLARRLFRGDRPRERGDPWRGCERLRERLRL